MVKLTNHGALYFIVSDIVILPTITTVDTKITPIWNTIGVIPGHIKDEVVLVGNHRDGAC
jgi:N-acetylated-alpha-linked acidic dipeptidase